MKRSRPMHRGELEDEVSLWSAPFGRLLLDAVPYRSGQRILDIGCGAGFPLLELAERIWDSTATGIDPSPAACRVARRKSRERGLPRVRVYCCGAEQLPLADRSIDLIVSNNGLTNVADLDKALQECRRVIAPGGLLVAAFNLPGTMTEWYRVLRRVMNRHGIADADRRINAHIAGKRPTVAAFAVRLKRNGWRMTVRTLDAWTYRFSGSSALFRHTFLGQAFVPSWRALIPPEKRTPVLRECRRILDSAASPGLRLTIPMVCITAVPVDGPARAARRTGSRTRRNGS